jgi:arabinofuranan 3-O-arabinosyltransferase
MSITSLLETLLSLFCRPLGAPDYPGGTEKTNIDNALDFLVKTVPQFVDLVRGKDVLDFGCGLGWQAIALAHQGVARSVVGLDIRLTDLARENASRYQVHDRVHFTNSLLPGQLFDVAYSCSSFEHLGDPEGILRQMLAVTKPGGHVIVSFAEPWYSPHGLRIWMESRSCRG